MESQIVRPRGHSYDEDPHKIRLHSEGEEDHHHDKKSVLKKVKAKAKKIKETLKKHGHGHDQGPDHDEEEDGDEDEEMEEEPEVHGAPMYESTARSYVPGQEENLGQPRVHLGRTTALGTDHDAPLDRPDTGNNQTKMTDPNWTFFSGQPRVNFGGSTALEEDPPSPKDRPEAFSPSNYQTKVTDPTGAGGAEAGITPILRSFGRMNVFDEPEPKPKPGPEQNLSTGSHDQFSPEPLPTKTTTIPENPQSVPECFNATKREDQPQDNKIGNQSSYTEKISYATSAVADKAISAKNAVASKLGYGGNDNAVAPHMHEGEGTAKSAPVGEYGREITATLTEKLAPVYEKVAVAGSTVMSKVYGTGSDTGTEKQGGVKGPDKGVSVKEYLADKLRPGDEDRALSEVISDVLHRQKYEKEKAAKASQPAVGEVRESEEVARRLGTGEENAGEGVDSGNASPRTGVVDRLKGAVSSWFGKGGECQTSQDPLKDNIAFSSSATEEVGHSDEDYNVGERRLQESSN